MTRLTKKRRWHRFAIPLGPVFAVIIAAVVVHAILEPDTSEEHFLSPEKTADTSAAGLAEMLRAKGIRVKRETRMSEALTATQAEKGDATLFIPAPEFVRTESLWLLRTSPAGTRVVLVEPGDRQLANAVPDLAVSGKRWATAVTSPGTDCTLTSAGPAAVTRTRYGQLLREGETTRARVCYDYGLVSLRYHQVEFVVVGSSDPFRDDRLSEYDNAALAVDLLGRKSTLVWLDLHEMEPRPAGDDPPVLPPVDGNVGEGEGRGEGEREGNAAGSARQRSPFPPWLMPGLLMLLLIAIAVAFARGRRLGAPVREPLPIDVRGAETAIGRSRLYRRAKAREPALEVLRVEARRRIAEALKTPLDRAQLLGALTATLGADPDLVADILYGPAPESDDELRTRSAELLLLVEQVTKGRS